MTATRTASRANETREARCRLTDGRTVPRLSGVHFLVLTCASDELERRIRARAGADSAIRNIAKHLTINVALARAEVPPPHSSTVVDTTGLGHAGTISAARHWVRGRS
ncbi:hypothetical protein [Lentzea sp. E54]|uniref:hypothetical protein n=1 Tax=Lentzea xerophila TaxID=3435883 RepID=UPI003DA65233